MISLGIRYLSGYAAAMDLARQKPEWPVHPGRVFLAMAAAYYETGAAPEERLALEWLEQQPPPALNAGAGCERAIYKAYVPVNDNHNGIVGRSRQERSFPKIWLEDDTAFLTWPKDPPDQIRGALASLCRKVTRIGHSASVVQMWLVDSPAQPAPNWIPDDSASSRFRVPEPGTLASCDAAFNGAAIVQYDLLDAKLKSATGKNKKLIATQVQEAFPGGRPQSERPTLPRWQGYAPVSLPSTGSPPLPGPFEPDLIVLSKREGSNLGLQATLALTGAFRNALIKSVAAEGFVPESITGHATDGSPTQLPHVAVFPLPFVGREHADGHVVGLAIAVPRNLDPLSRKALGCFLFDAMTGQEREIKIWTAYWRWTLKLESSGNPLVALDSRTWASPSKTWATVTPVVLHHHPKKNRPWDVERIVREAFLSALLPEPESLIIRAASYFEGAGHARDMPTFSEGGPTLSNYQTHVVATFPEPVEGPILVGRGRFRGYGLFRPIPSLSTEKKR